MGHRTHREISNYIEGYIDAAQAENRGATFRWGEVKDLHKTHEIMNWNQGVLIHSRQMEGKMEKEEEYVIERIREKNPQTIL